MPINTSMDYGRYDPDRYAPDVETAVRQGLEEYRHLAAAIGPDRRQRILEIGCGCGSLLRALRAEGFENCRGIDIDARLVQHGKSVLGVEVETGRWRPYLEAGSERYDRILSLDVRGTSSSSNLFCSKSERICCDIQTVS